MWGRKGEEEGRAAEGGGTYSGDEEEAEEEEEEVEEEEEADGNEEDEEDGAGVEEGAVDRLEGAEDENACEEAEKGAAAEESRNAALVLCGSASAAMEDEDELSVRLETERCNSSSAGEACDGEATATDMAAAAGQKKRETAAKPHNPCRRTKPRQRPRPSSERVTTLEMGEQ